MFFIHDGFGSLQSIGYIFILLRRDIRQSYPRVRWKRATESFLFFGKSGMTVLSFSRIFQFLSLVSLKKIFFFLFNAVCVWFKYLNCGKLRYGLKTILNILKNKFLLFIDIETLKSCWVSTYVCYKYVLTSGSISN